MTFLDEPTTVTSARETAVAGVTAVLAEDDARTMLEALPPDIDEVIVVRGSTSARALRRTAFAAARNACVLIAGPGADVSALAGFVDALRAGAETPAPAGRP